MHEDLKRFEINIHDVLYLDSHLPCLTNSALRFPDVLSKSPNKLG